MSRIWLVKVPECGYDEYDAFVVRADSGERAIEIVAAEFDKHQGAPTVEPVDNDGPEGKVLGSFNAG